MNHEEMHGFRAAPEDFAPVLGREEGETDDHFAARCATAVGLANTIQQTIVSDQATRMVVDLACMTLHMDRTDVLRDTLKLMLWLTSLSDEELHERAAQSLREEQEEIPGQYL